MVGYSENAPASPLPWRNCLATLRACQNLSGSGSGLNAIGGPAWYILHSMEVHVREANLADVEFARSLYFQTMRGMIESLFGWDQRPRASDVTMAAAEAKAYSAIVLGATGNVGGRIVQLL